MGKKIIVLFIVLSAQIAFARAYYDVRPELPIMEPPPTIAAMKLQSFGDAPFYFRWLGLQVQNAGDTYGRFTPLKDYDYALLEAWLTRLDALDARSNWMPTLAGHYFALTQNKEDTRHIINYLDQHASRNPTEKWWWFMQATYIANRRLGDQELALMMARKLREAKAENKPIWADQMEAFLLEKKGQYAEALAIIEAILQEREKLTEGEMNFIRYFIEDRLEMLKEAEERGLLDTFR